MLCIGRLYCDLVFTGVPRMPTLGTEVFAEALGLHAGGGAYISAATFAALGRRAALAATLPAAPFDAVVTREARGAGVDLALCRPGVPGAEPQITVAIAHGGDRAFLTRATGPALPPLDAAAMAASGAAHLHIGELRTLKESPGVLDAARAAGMTVSLDCSWDDALSARDAALIAAVDVFLPNEEEAARLAELGVAAGAAPLTVVKRGAAGADALTGGRRLTVPGLAVPVADTTGAGDAFNGGFLDSWLAGRALDDCLRAGNACGAASVQAAGGTGGLGAIRAAAGSAAGRSRIAN
ncbi:carbohydrate kinase [Rhodobacteraceae bacterium 2CG4]|uniref:Carbohydrate kinase n=1 Tax=Halovulum marinum TaxID=2662447 RepID=A0A6L5YXC1_9RHOB|nr:carbohydrate kinase [Halovulum marinum]